MLSWGAKATTEQALPATSSTGGEARIMTADMQEPAEDYARIAMDGGTLNLLRAVNDQVNGLFK